MGLNEFAGYLAVAAAAFASGVIAERVGLRPEPFYLGAAFAGLGLALSVLLVKDTMSHVRLEAAGGAGQRHEPAPSMREVFARVSWRDPALSAASQAGLVNNLNDGIAWGLFPLFFAASGLSVREIGILAAMYPATWGLAQLGTGALSDRVGRKWLIASGMIVQGIALIGMVRLPGFNAWLLWAMLLGLGTAMVYPTLLAAIGDVAHASWRGSAVGVYRLWRDLGYPVGALLGGVLADRFGMGISIGLIGGLTVVSGVHVALRMPETARLVPTS